MTEPTPSKRTRKIKPVHGLYGGLSLLILVWALAIPTDLATRSMHSWNLFHYVIGTKYFDELGYYDIYRGMILVDRDSEQILAQLAATRNLHTYQVESLATAIEHGEADRIRERFSDSRWEEFAGDLNAILSQRPDGFWSRPLTDRGFNPSPVWLLVHEPLLNAIDIQHPPTLVLVVLSQNLLLLMTFIGVRREFGWRVTLCFVGFFYLYFGNAGRWFSGYFSYDWFILSTWTVILHRRGQMVPAAACLSFAAMMRGFPGLLAVYPAVHWCWSAIRLRLPERRHTVFLVTLVACCTGFFLLSSLARGGFDVWAEWVEKIQLHRHHHILTESRIGLQYLFVQNFAGPWELGLSEREQLVAANALAYQMVAGVLIGMTLLAMLRQRDHDGLLLGIPLIFFMTVLSRYYFSMGALLFAWSASASSGTLTKVCNWVLAGLLLFYPIAALLFPDFPKRGRYFVFNAGMALYFVTIVVGFLVTDRNESAPTLHGQPCNSPKRG